MLTPHDVFNCHQGIELSLPFHPFDLPPSPLHFQLFVVNMLVCEFACNSTPPCKFALSPSLYNFSSVI
jgi:hypothetical protein